MPQDTPNQPTLLETALGGMWRTNGMQDDNELLRSAKLAARLHDPVEKSLILMRTHEGHERRILLCVTGLSPQIVTETVYALAVKSGWIPDEIQLITTRE